jgi:signal peptidase I
MFAKKTNKLIIIFFIIFIAWYISTYWIQFALIQGDSMLPTYHNLQLVFIDKHTSNFDYNDVIIFRSYGLKATLIKRIVACPSDTVQILDGILYVNDKPSSLIAQETRLSYSGIASSKLVLNDNEYFVLGDNYEASKDSRYEEIGIINQSYIIGKVVN